jgi:hypothetical protein
MKGDPIPDDLKAEVDRLIKKFGSKRAAHEAIEAAEVKGKAGRRKGTQQYLIKDLELLLWSELLQTEHRLIDRKRVGRGLPPIKPKRRDLIAQVIPEETKPAGLGKNKKAAVARLAKRGSLARVLIEAIREHRPDLARRLPDNADARLHLVENDPNKANFATVLLPLLMFYGLLQRHPRLRSKLAASLKYSQTLAAHKL